MASNFLTGFFHQECEDILNKTEILSELLCLLRFEGKTSEGKNLRSAQSTFQSFEKELIEHMGLEDKVIFNYIEKHVPKFEAVIYLLRSEHKDIIRNLKNFKTVISRFKTAKKSNRLKCLAEIQESGTYLIYLLKNHVQAECDSLYRAVDKYLKKDEKEQLKAMVFSWFNKKNTVRGRVFYG